jgi:hypothetical protein
MHQCKLARAAAATSSGGCPIARGAIVQHVGGPFGSKTKRRQRFFTSVASRCRRLPVRRLTALVRVGCGSRDVTRLAHAYAYGAYVIGLALGGAPFSFSLLHPPTFSPPRSVTTTTLRHDARISPQP